MSTGPKVAELSQLGLPRLLFAILRQRFTGVITLPQEEPLPGRRSIWVRCGMPVFTDWANDRERLGQLVVARRLVSPSGCGLALHERGRFEQLGQVLLRKGIVSELELEEILHEQCYRKLLEAFTLRGGRARMVLGKEPRGRDLHRPINVLRLIHAGVTAHYDEGRIFSEMGAVAKGPLRTTLSMRRYHRHFAFRDRDISVLKILARGTDLAELMRYSEATPTRVAQIVYILWCCQLLRVGHRGLTAVDGGVAVSPLTWLENRGGEKRPAEPYSERRQRRHEAEAEAICTAATFMHELCEFEARLAVGAHPFDLLGVPITASHDEIRRVWRTIGSRFHPDALPRQGYGHLRERAIDVFSSLSEALRAVLSPSSREALTAEIAESHRRESARRPASAPANS